MKLRNDLEASTGSTYANGDGVGKPSHLRDLCCHADPVRGAQQQFPVIATAECAAQALFRPLPVGDGLLNALPARLGEPVKAFPRMLTSDPLRDESSPPQQAKAPR